LRWFDASPRRATPKGQNLHHLHSTASSEVSYIDLTLCARGALKQQAKKALSAGGKINDAPAGSVGLTMIRPDDALTIGRASARVAPLGYGGSWSVDSYAICAFPPPNLRNSGVIGDGPEVVWNCPAGTTPLGAGGGGGLVDLGPFYLVGLAPTAKGVWVRMTGASDRWGTLAQDTCSN
jgi:hypothetical protein